LVSRWVSYKRSQEKDLTNEYQLENTTLITEDNNKVRTCKIPIRSTVVFPSS